jgi:hypothetical protein
VVFPKFIPYLQATKELPFSAKRRSFDSPFASLRVAQDDNVYLDTLETGCLLRFRSPRSINAEGTEIGGFALVKIMLDEVIDAAAAGTSAKAGAQFGYILGGTGGYHFHFAFFGVSHPPAQVEFAGLALDKPAEAYPLHATLNQKMKNHGKEPWPVLQMCLLRAT